jgi:hypothetical protein
MLASPDQQISLTDHPIPLQIASESYSANQMPKCVFTQPGSNRDRGLRLWRFPDVRFSNQPFGVKRFQTIHHHCSVDVTHGLVLLL